MGPDALASGPSEFLGPSALRPVLCGSEWGKSQLRIPGQFQGKVVIFQMNVSRLTRFSSRNLSLLPLC